LCPARSVSIPPRRWATKRRCPPYKKFIIPENLWFSTYLYWFVKITDFHAVYVVYVSPSQVESLAKLIFNGKWFIKNGSLRIIY